MTLNELIERAVELQMMGFGNDKVFDTNGYPIIALNGQDDSDIDIPTAEHHRVYIESEF